MPVRACGLPVLVTDDGGPQENMVDQVTGFVCSDLRGFARRTVELAWNPERHARLREAARHFALNRQWTSALEPVFCAYHEAIAISAGAQSNPGSDLAFQHAGPLLSATSPSPVRKP